MNQPKIYLIHDEKRVDREILFKREMEQQGIKEYEIVSADKSTNNPVINIARAHKECIRRAQAQDLDQVMILEDDVRFVAPGAYNRFLEVLKGLPEAWDILIGGSYEYIFDHTKTVNAVGIAPVTALKRFSGLFCYIIHERFYEKFLSIPEGKNIDKEVSKVSGASLWMAWPQLCLCHDGIKSDNTGKITNYNLTYKKYLKEWQNG